MANKDDVAEDFESVYDGHGREELVEDDEISPEEEAFMKGYDQDIEESVSDEDDEEAYEKAFEEAEKEAKSKKKKKKSKS